MLVASRRALLKPYSRPNLILRPQELDNAAWTKSGASVSANAIAAPDGTLTADRLIEDVSGGGQHRVTQDVTIPAGAIVTFSAHGKTNTRSEIALLVVGGAQFLSTYYTLSTGVIRANSDDLGSVFFNRSAQIVAAPNGWYRCILLFQTATVTTLTCSFCLSDGSSVNYAGDGSSSVYGWGVKLEIGADATVYVPQ